MRPLVDDALDLTEDTIYMFNYCGDLPSFLGARAFLWLPFKNSRRFEGTIV